MGEPVPSGVVEAFFEAYATRDADRLAAFLHDDIEWTISGPVDVLPFCGVRHGKAAVVDMIKRQVPRIFHDIHFTLDAKLIDGDQAATFIRFTAHGADGRAISYRLANLMRFRDGKVIRYLTLFDSFDAVEQVTGHALSVHDGKLAEMGNLVPV